MVFEAVNATTGDTLPLSVFRDAIGEAMSDSPPGGRSRAPADGGTALSSPLFFPNPLPSAGELTELLFDEALKRAEGNQSVAARLLGVSPQAVSKRLKARKAKDSN
jgi:transcriptional regulator with AAA-type ATPase domain